MEVGGGGLLVELWIEVTFEWTRRGVELELSTCFFLQWR